MSVICTAVLCCSLL